MTNCTSIFLHLAVFHLSNIWRSLSFYIFSFIWGFNYFFVSVQISIPYWSCFFCGLTFFPSFLVYLDYYIDCYRDYNSFSKNAVNLQLSLQVYNRLAANYSITKLFFTAVFCSVPQIIWFWQLTILKIVLFFVDFKIIIALACNTKCFAIALLFFFSLNFLSVLLDRLPKDFLGKFYHLLPRKCVTKIVPISLDTLNIVSVKIVP